MRRERREFDEIEVGGQVWCLEDESVSSAQLRKCAAKLRN